MARTLCHANGAASLVEHNQAMSTTDTKKIADTIRRLAGATIFSCRFVKRTTGQERLMVCRLGVTKHLSGGEPTYSPSSKGLLPVWDTQRRAYRSIPLDAIISIKIAGIEYHIADELSKIAS